MQKIIYFLFHSYFCLILSFLEALKEIRKYSKRNKM